MDLSILMWIIVIGTSIWVAIDASSIGVKKGQISGVADMGPVGWFFVCLLLWIVGFPFYLSKRGEYIRINTINKNKDIFVVERTNNSGSLDELERLANLKDRGILTEQEFQMQKAKVMGLPVSTHSQSTMQQNLPKVKPATPPPTDNRVLYCPACGKGMMLRSINIGNNICPHCRQTFEVEP